MGTQVVKVPDIGEGIVEVEIVAWRVQPGEAVAADQPLVDVMTDKATVEVPAPVAGRVLATRGAPGERLAVGSELLRIETGGDAGARTAPAPAEVPAAAPAAAVRQPAPATPRADKPTASPSVRRHARELGLDLAEVRGSGPEGRVLHEDLLRAAGPASPATAAPSPAPAPSPGVQRIPLTGLRRQIADRMEAARAIPHFSYVEEVDVTALEETRAALNRRFESRRGHLGLLPLIARALVLALGEFPQMNARYDAQARTVERHAAVHLGIATQTAAGLTVPVLHGADALDPWQLAAGIARLAAAVRDGKATRAELTGSTITLSSLGPLGGIVATPVINAPEVAIVGVNRVVERPAFRDGAVVARRLMNLSSSFDHRLVDGQDAALFVQTIRERLECPALLFAPAV